MGYSFKAVMRYIHHKSTIIAITVTLLLLLLASTLPAQCFIPCTGRGQLIPSYPSYTISASVTWSGAEYYRMGNNDLTITGTGTVLTIDGPCIDFNHTAPREIIIDSGATLILTGGTKIYGSAATPWKGIRIRSGGTLVIEGSTVPYNATIAYAKNAVLAENSNSESVFDISGASFCDNQTAIRVEPFAEPMISSVVGSKFSAQGIIGKKIGYLNTGIDLNGVRPSNDFLIGDGQQYHFGLENEFENLEIAINAINSNILVVDNFIHDVGIGIKAAASPGTPGRLQAGLIYDPLFPHRIFNVIENAQRGIVVANNVHTNLYQNKIMSDYNAASGTYKMDIGIQIINNCPHIFISRLTVEGFNEFGVYIDNISGADSIVVDQVLLLEQSGFSEVITPTGVWMSDAAATVVNMNSNTITNVLRGVELLNVTHPQLFFTLVTYAAKTDAGGIHNAYGIKLTNCADAIAGSNSCIGNYEPGLEDVVRGIYTDHCTNFMLSDNFITDAGYGMYIYETSTEGQLLCNLMENCNVGMYLLDIGGEAGAPPLHSPMGDAAPSENHWFPEATANRITTDEYLSTTKAEYTIWNYDDSPSGYSLSGFINETGGTAPTLIEMNRIGEPCLAFTELSGKNDQFNKEASGFVIDFDTWANTNASEGKITASGSWFMRYELWKKIMNHNFTAEDQNDKITAIYEDIRKTNIPVFAELQNALSKSEYQSAKYLLEHISPVNDLEYYWKLTAGIYLNSINSSEFFELHKEDEEVLKEIASLNAALYGPAVFYAWGMLDTVIEHNKASPENLYFVSEPEELLITPNPAGNYFTFSDILDKQYTVELYNTLGERILVLHNIPSGDLISLSQVESGVYFVVIRQEHKTIATEKLVISK